MCGIVGLVDFSKSIDRDAILAMTQSLAHRGPDGYGIWHKDNVAIGHRRLSIIDLELGQQPMCNEDESIWLTFNGEIYNFHALREQLIDSGHIFKTNSDTEVIVHSYEQWGEDCVKRFRGMFAFGLVDLPKKKIFLARDNLGIKPLVYYFDGKRFAFASELQALKKIPGGDFQLDLTALDEYLWLQYIPAPKTIYRKITKLKPGHTVGISFAGRLMEEKCYWEPVFSPVNGRTEQDWVEELDGVLRASVKAHLVSDVPFGAFLSGGIDSSAIVTYMAQVLDTPVKTFTIGFDEKEYNEAGYARLVADRWQTEHHVEIVRPQALEILPELVKHYGEPFGDSSAIPAFYVCQLARRHVPMVLTGDGGDEFFCGYNSYLGWLDFLSGVDNYPVWKKIVRPVMEVLFPLRYPKRPEVKVEPSLANWLRLIHYAEKGLRQNLWRPEYVHNVQAEIPLFEKHFAKTSSFPDPNKVQYLDIHTYLPYDILTKVDIVSMYHSLETRTPIVDKVVAEFAMSLPPEYNLLKQQDGHWMGKMLLKKVLEKYYPKSFIYRKKMGFAVPIAKWLSAGGELYKYTVNQLLDPQAKILEYFNPRMVKSLLATNTIGLVWLLLFLEEWLEQNT